MSERQEELHRRFRAIWDTPPGLGTLTAVNHTNVGHRYILTGLVFFLIGGLLAMVIRSQLAWAGNSDVDHALYAQMVTMHGTTMMFLFAVPMMEGFAVYLIPKMIGARDLPFPRLSAYGYWCYLFGGIFLYSGFLFGAAPDGGWFMYVPLNDKAFAPGLNPDFWLLGVTFVEISAVSAAVELIVAILKTRTPGMGIARMPLFAWYILVVAFMILFGFPPLILASVLLEMERTFGLVFYEAERGGDPLLWQHLFWLFGHPEVYIIFLPAAGVVTTVVATFARRAFAGYTWVVIAVVGTGFLSFGLWVHHMFTVGIPLLSLGFFSAASMAVAIPSGIQVFAWIANLWQGCPESRVPLLYVLGFLFIFVAGGLTGVMVALVPFDWQVHDTHFVVAHLHYVLFGGMVFPMFAGLYYWLPLVSGRKVSEGLARVGFWTVFIGFNITFGPMHLTGMLGMPRRVYTYGEGLGWEWLNLVSTLGGFLLSFGVLTILVDILVHFRFASHSKGNPWHASTLEWTIVSPVPSYNFVSLPQVSGRDPVWEQKGLAEEMREGRWYLADPSAGKRETLVTSASAARPEQVVWLAQSSWIPLVAAVVTSFIFIGIISSQYWLALVGTVATAAAFLAWAWDAPYRGSPLVIDAGLGLTLPIQAATARAPGWWGLLMTLGADATAFVSLIFAFFFLWTVSPLWPPPGFRPEVFPPTLALLFLMLSSGSVWWAMRANGRGYRSRLRLGLLVAVGLSLVFLALQLNWLATTYPNPGSHAYPSVVWTIWGFQFSHLAIGWLMAGFAWVRSRTGDLDAVRPLEGSVAALYWHYTVLLAAGAYPVTVLFPRFA